MPTFSNRKKYSQKEKNVFIDQKKYFLKIAYEIRPSPSHALFQRHLQGSQPLHPAAVNATVCSLPLAMQLHARNCKYINVALTMPKKYQSHIITLFSCSASPVFACHRRLRQRTQQETCVHEPIKHYRHEGCGAAAIVSVHVCGASTILQLVIDSWVPIPGSHAQRTAHNKDTDSCIMQCMYKCALYYRTAHTHTHTHTHNIHDTCSLVYLLLQRLCTLGEFPSFQIFLWGFFGGQPGHKNPTFSGIQGARRSFRWSLALGPPPISSPVKLILCC